jgi:fused signal recognition particle receptor
MEIVILLVVLALVAIAGVTFVSLRGREKAGELEPPAPSGGTATAVIDRPVLTEEPSPEAPPADTVVEPPVETEPAVEVEPVAEVEVEEPPAPVKPSFRERLSKARSALSGAVSSILSRSGIDDETWDELEEGLIRADVGVQTTTELLDRLRVQVDAFDVKEPDALLDLLKKELISDLSGVDRSLRDAGEAPTIWLFVGVNGVGKTTTIGKLGKRATGEGRSVVMAAGDTFRAAAAEQLGMWAERAGAELVRGSEGADPSSVIFDAVEAAAARGADLVLADTAGRLHTKVNLMEELRKVRRVADKGAGTVTEVLLVIDATTGQNGLVQAKQFTDAVEVTGVVLTKLDGSAKGGIVLAIQHELDIPVKLVGLGEGADDLVEFDPEAFVGALFE